jgi:hypothetical protein
MKAHVLRSRFERALRSSLLAVLPVAAACGGSIETTQDSGTPDAAPTDGAVTDVRKVDGGSCAAIDVPANPPPCGYEVTLTGDPKTCGFPTDGGQIDPSVCSTLCGPLVGPATTFCYWSAQNPAKLQCGGGCIGRRPAGLRPESVEYTQSIVGAYLAEAAFLEAASIDAFQILHDELAHHGAPRTLRSAALVARADEVRHAAVMRALAERWGARVATPSVARSAPRSLVEIALENAVEGQVRETWGALLASFQAKHAASARVRAAMRTIAREEAEHGLLGLRIGLWVDARLDTQARAAVRAARAGAIATLFAELAVEPDPILRTELGLPTAAEARRLAEELFRELDVLSAA